ncbi:MAG: hypothetical protein WC788_06660 [Candidatus Paceibacterota bacterium]
MTEADEKMFYCWIKLRLIKDWECKGLLSCEKGVAKGGCCFGKFVINNKKPVK